MAVHRPFTTVVEGLKVAVVRKVHSEYSNVVLKDHSKKIFTIKGFDYGGRTHNQYICAIYIYHPSCGQISAVLDELALLNPNGEPEGEFVVCVGCGASMAECDMKVLQHLRGIKACPSCGVLEPQES
jgi:hypothetical protein